MELENKRKIEERILNFELNEQWDSEVFDNPETYTLMPDKVDYLNKKCSSKIFNKISNLIAVKFFDGELKKKNYQIEKIVGLENYTSVKGGAVITCNHVSIYDHYVIYKAIKPYLAKNQQLYKVIREGNFTNFGGLFGFFFKHCNTLPLSSNSQTMIKFLKAFKTLISRGEKILIYPEQAMWKNYRKPRPCKSGAFNLAVKNNAPIIPMFLTFEDSDKLDADGFNCPKYTLWIEPAIYLDENLSQKENIINLQKKNYDVWKDVYERAYDKKLEYLKK